MTATPPTAAAATGAPPAGGASTPASSSQGNNPNSILGQNDFLKLMVAQLQAQNPLEPGNSNEFVNELAQLTQVEQTTNLANASELSGAVQLIGHKVSYNSPSGVSATGTVAERPVELLRHDRDRRRRPRHNPREHHGSRMSPISNPALVPPGGLGAPVAPAGGAGATAGGRSAQGARRARPPGPSFADTLAQAGAVRGGRAVSSPSMRSRASSAAGSSSTRARSEGFRRVCSAPRARARATPSSLSTAPRSWCPSATARSSRPWDPNT